MEHGVGVWQTGDLDFIRQNYSVEHENGVIKKVIEKPRAPTSNLCGLGFYFLDKHVFRYIEKTPPSALRNEVEITDVLQNMINGGEKIHVVPFVGQYLNITFPEDTKKAENILRES
jgi:dTDP-glucose pyrophosphorylase